MLNKTKIPALARVEAIYESMCPTERWAFYLLSALLVLSTFALMSQVHTKTTILVPSSGGKITEGVIGAPRFVNPVLAISQTDKDLSELIYAGLMTRDTNGSLIPELAQSYTISDDALTYTFTLKPHLIFHDGTPLTTDDVLFTIQKAIQPDIKSPERANWEGVTIKKIDDTTITFSLEKPYAQFLQNTLLGILPEEHWGKLTADEFIFSKLNTEPIGSGPYKFTSAQHNTSGIPSSFTLERFTDYVRGTPYIKKFILNFYPGKEAIEEALSNNTITSMSEVSPQSVKELTSHTHSIALTATLPRIFAVFFNQNHNDTLSSKTIRTVLREVLNKEVLIKKVLSGYAQSIPSAILSEEHPTDKKVHIMTVQDARSKIESLGWKLSDDDEFYHKSDETLSLTLTTANTAELKEMATDIANTWTNIGVQVKVEVFEPGNLAQSVLRTRQYDALLFGEIVGTEQDPYAFWHSSQRNDPGLNIANYTNATVDSLLIKARKTVNSNERAAIYQEVASVINDDVPAIFLYAPKYIYITNKSVHGIHFAQSMEPHERFANVHLWHINTGRIWQFLEK